MIFNKPIVVYFIATLFGANVFSQSKPSDDLFSLKAKVEKATNAIKSLECNFIQTQHINILENEVVSKGKLYFKNPGSVKWVYTEPKQFSNIMKGDELYVVEGSNSKKIDLNSNKIVQNLNELVTGSIQGNIFNERLFTVTYSKSDNSFHAVFLPKEKKMRRFYSSFELTFSTTDYHLQKLVMREPNGDFTEIEFFDKKLNLTLPNDIFVVNK